MRNIRVKRPRDFDFNPKVEGARGVPQPSPLNLDLLKMPAYVEDSTNKLKISSIPFKANEIKIIEALSKFGKIKTFCLQRDPKTNVSTGTAYAEFLNLDVASRQTYTPVVINDVQVSVKINDMSQTPHNQLLSQNQPGGILGYKPQANSLMQPQPSPVMSTSMIQQSQSINPNTLAQQQQFQKEQQQAREKEQAEQANADRLNPSQVPQNQATLSSGFAQSLYGRESSESGDPYARLSDSQRARGSGSNFQLGQSTTPVPQYQSNGMQNYLNNIKNTTAALHQQQMQAITSQHMAQMPQLGEGGNQPAEEHLVMAMHRGQRPADMIGRIGTTANVGVAKKSASAYYIKGMTYPQLVGKKRINIDPGEHHTKVVLMKGFLNKALLETEQYYGEVLEDIEKQTSKFGSVKEIKILKAGDGYYNMVGQVIYF